MPGIGKEQRTHTKSIARLWRATNNYLWRILLSCFVFLCLVTRCSQFFFAALCATCVACSFTSNIENDIAVVATAICACTVRLAESATFTLCSARRDQSMMASALCGLRPVAAHSDYHGQDFTRNDPVTQEKDLDMRGPSQVRGAAATFACRHLLLRAV